VKSWGPIAVLAVTAIELAAAVTCTATPSAALTTEITMAASVSGAATVSGTFQSEAAALEASVTNTATVNATLDVVGQIGPSYRIVSRPGRSPRPIVRSHRVLRWGAKVETQVATGDIAASVTASASTTGALSSGADDRPWLRQYRQIRSARSRPGKARVRWAQTETTWGAVLDQTSSTVESPGLAPSLRTVNKAFHGRRWGPRGGNALPLGSTSEPCQVFTSGGLTTQITPAAAVACAVTVSGDLTSSVGLSTSAPCIASTLAGLSTQITAAASVSCAASTTGDLSTAIRFAAVVDGSVTTSGDLTATDSFLADVALEATVAGDLTTEIAPAAVVQGVVTSSGALTTVIACAAAPTVTASGTAALSTEITPAAVVACNVTAAGDLTTTVGLTTSVFTETTATGSLSVVPALNASVSCVGTVSADLTVEAIIRVTPITFTLSLHDVVYRIVDAQADSLEIACADTQENVDIALKCADAVTVTVEG
jgi:hypothetical protein